MKPYRIKDLLLKANIILLCLLPFPGPAQQVISVRAGLINEIVGEVHLDEKRIKLPSNSHYEVSDGMKLRTESGLAEIQLGAGAFLRANLGTRIHMENSSLENMVLRLERGSVLVEVLEIYKDNQITLLYGDASVRLEKEGLYRLDSAASRLRVYGGKAQVRQSGKKISVKQDWSLAFPSLKKSRFDREINDVFHYWAAYRSFNRNKDIMKLNWYSDHWQQLFMNHYRNEYYQVTFHDKDEEDDGPPFSDWYRQWELDEIRRKNEEIRQIQQHLENLKNSMPPSN